MGNCVDNQQVQQGANTVHIEQKSPQQPALNPSSGTYPQPGYGTQSGSNGQKQPQIKKQPSGGKIQPQTKGSSKKQAPKQPPSQAMKDEINDLTNKGNTFLQKWQKYEKEQDAQGAYQNFKNCLEKQEQAYGSDSIELCKTLMKLNKALSNLSRRDEGTQCLQRCIEIFNNWGKESEEKAQAFFFMGVNQYRDRKHQEATEWFEKSIKVFKSLKSKSTTYQNIVQDCKDMFQVMQNWRKAVEYSILLFELFQETNDDDDRIRSQFYTMIDYANRLGDDNLIKKLKKKYNYD